MARKAYSIRTYEHKTTSAGWDLCLTLDADLITEAELVAAPGVMAAVQITAPNRNPMLATFLIGLDPLYDTPEEARAELESWLNERKAKPLDDVWNE